MKIRLTEIPSEGLKIEESRPALWLDEQFPPSDLDPYKSSGDVLFVLSMHKETQNVRVEGTVEADFRLVCGRCLREMPHHQRIRVREVFVPATKVKQPWELEESDETIGDAECATYEDDEVNVGLYCAEQLLLSLPRFPRCVEGEGCYGKSMDWTERWDEESAEGEPVASSNPKWLEGLKQAKKKFSP